MHQSHLGHQRNRLNTMGRQRNRLCWFPKRKEARDRFVRFFFSGFTRSSTSRLGARQNEGGFSTDGLSATAASFTEWLTHQTEPGRPSFLFVSSRFQHRTREKKKKGCDSRGKKGKKGKSVYIRRRCVCVWCPCNPRRQTWAFATVLSRSTRAYPFHRQCWIRFPCARPTHSVCRPVLLKCHL